jgi:hypothetical protein
MHAFLATPIPLDDKGLHSIFIWSGVLIALMLLAFGGYSLLKKWMSDTEVPERGGGFGLSDLRRLHEEGKMSTEEYEQTRAKMVAAAKRMTGNLPEVIPRRSPPPKAADINLPPSTPQ